MLGSFIYAKNDRGEYLLNQLGEYMFCAADGQHRCAIQVFYNFDLNIFVLKLI